MVQLMLLIDYDETNSKTSQIVWQIKNNNIAFV